MTIWRGRWWISKRLSDDGDETGIHAHHFHYLDLMSKVDQVVDS